MNQEKYFVGVRLFLEGGGGVWLGEMTLIGVCVTGLNETMMKAKR